MALDILIVSQYTGLGTNNRFLELAKRLAEGPDHVELVVSSFSHREKRQIREGVDSSESFHITHIDEPGYTKNVSLKRVLSHKKLASNLKRYLASRSVPSVLYCAVPSLAIAEVVAEFAEEHGVRLILDVQDLWPEAFLMVLGRGRLSKLVLSPILRRADKIYKSADSVVTVSNTYSARIRKVRQRDGVSTVYIGTNLTRFDTIAPITVRESHTNELVIVYIGTLGHSYDLPTVFLALQKIEVHRKNEVKLIVMGGGPLQEEFRLLARKTGAAIEFLGRLPYEEMVPLLRNCDVAVNPIMPGSAGSIINKVADYAAAGLPVINTQESPEYRALLETYDAGMSCQPQDSDALSSAILSLLDAPDRREAMGRGSRQMAEDLFDRSKTYSEIISLIKSSS